MQKQIEILTALLEQTEDLREEQIELNRGYHDLAEILRMPSAVRARPPSTIAEILAAGDYNGDTNA